MQTNTTKYRSCLLIMLCLVLCFGHIAWASDNHPGQSGVTEPPSSASPIPFRSSQDTTTTRNHGGVAAARPSFSNDCDVVNTKGLAMALVRRLTERATPGKGQCPRPESSLLEQLLE
jgi:hypothetical protein